MTSSSDSFADLVSRVPVFARRILHVGSVDDALVQALKARGAIEVIHQPTPHGNAPDECPFSTGRFDCIVVTLPDRSVEETVEYVRPLAAALDRSGFFLFVLSAASTPDAINQLLNALGMIGYRMDRRADAVDNGQHVVLAVHGDYDPLRQAQECFDANRPQDAMEVLRLIPQQFYAHPAANAAVSADMLVYALAIDATADPGGRLSRFFEAQTIFYAVIQHLPRFADAYRAFAEFWHRLGNDDMARRILRSVGHVVSDDKLEAQMRRYEPPRTVHIDFPLPPPWQPASRPPRILLITHKRPNYGLDVLCNALQTLIGPENIVDWPWKPTLHGEVAEEQRRYPCMFNYPGVKLSVRDLAEQLLAGRFDAIVFGDMEGHFDPRVLHVIMKAGTACPLIVLDQSDECVDYRHVMAAYLGREPVAIFKREMLTCYDYGPHVYPLPFAYSDDRIPGTVRVEGRSRPLFWAGHRQFSLRRLYIEHIETLLGLDLNQTFSQEEYVHALGDSRIGLNIYGFGYDTVRYWELPAHGCMLLAERLPIAVPHNFVDGTSAVFYDDLGELEQKLLYYIERPEETQAIAQAGHEHLKKYHSGTARAKQFLAWLQPYLPTST